MSEDNVLVSIVIPHWNGIEILSECLASLTKTSYHPYEIIIVDNCSTDGSQRWIKNTYPNITLIENNKNYGYAGGCNRGIQNANGELVVFLNNDTIQNPMWLGQLVDFIVKNPKIAALQPKILNYFDKSFFDYAGGAGGYMDIFGFPFARGRIFIEQEKDHGQYDDKKQCFWASGTALMVRKNLFIEAGSFDETFFAHMEEIDLCWRLQAMGYEVWSNPDSVIFHKNAVSLPMQTHKKYYLNHRNSLLMLFGNYSISNAFYLGIIRVIFDFMAMIYSIFKWDWNHFTGIVRAHLWIIFHPMTILKKRGKFKIIRATEDKIFFKNLYKKSVVVDYFIKKIRTYSEIDSKAL
tara:strand:+ start:542 stop:1591 length:1050 start_codon:yes stop_codon:yes gene_type:complete